MSAHAPDAGELSGKPLDRVLVVGASGPTGRLIVAACVAAGREVVALVRRPEPDAPPGVRQHRGDVLDQPSLETALAGCGAVLCALGSGVSLKPVTLLSEGTRNLVAAMRARGVGRLVVITGIGAGDSRGHGGPLYDWLIRPLLLGRVYADKDRQEAVVRGSGLDWTIVRPGFLTDGPATGRTRALTDLTGVTAGKIARADVARFMVEQLDDAAYRRAAVLISG